MKTLVADSATKQTGLAVLLVLLLTAAPSLLRAQASGAPPAPGPEVPDWALPSSPTHTQYAPPADFHRASRNFNTPIGIFQGQSDIGGALVPASASYDPDTKQYTINSAGYNIWYTRDEFRYLWKRMSGDVSLAADVTFPNPEAYGDRKIVLMIRQDLDDDSREIMARGARYGDGPSRPACAEEWLDYGHAISLQRKHCQGIMPQRIGIEKHDDCFALFVSVKGEPMHQFGPPISLHIDEPFYVGIGFCSHYPVTVDTGVVANVILENSAGKVQ